jgi:hypothetical protein
VTDTRHDGTRRRQLLFVAVGVVTAAALVIAIAGWVNYLSAPVDMHGNRVAYDSDVPRKVASKVAASASPTPNIGARFAVPSVGLDVPLGALTATNGVIEPPGFTGAYWVRNEGVSVDDGANGTVFIVMHSLRNGGIGPGNYLIDVKHQRAKVATGALVQVGHATYKITGSATPTKVSVPASSSIWANTPNRLVIITCLQKPEGGPSVKNMVITGTRIT